MSRENQCGSIKLSFILIFMLVGGGYLLWNAVKTAEEAVQAGGISWKQQTGRQEEAQTYRNSMGMAFELIPAGQFMMGSTIGDDEHPVHPVHIAKPFYIGKYEVTQAQWTTIMGTTLEQQKDKANPEWGFYGAGPDHPMYYVTWHEAQGFIRRMNTFEGGNLYRLPTEAEWEYACRAGATGEYAGNVDMMAWYGLNSGEQTHPVGQKQPNAWGLYDMTGNVWEWCQDWFDFYSEDVAWDPQGSPEGTLRIVRGGSWLIDRDGCRSADRVTGVPDRRNSSVGFRVVREVR